MAAAAAQRAYRCARNASLSCRTMKKRQGLTLIQFLFILLVGGIAALWLVDYLRARLA